jgi:hypothetical protein
MILSRKASQSSIQSIFIENCRVHVRGKNERVHVNDTFLHNASGSACGIGAMKAGLTHNDLHRSHRQCVQKYPVQDCDLTPLTNEIDLCRSFHSLVKSAACSLCTIAYYEPFSRQTNTLESNLYRRAPGNQTW